MSVDALVAGVAAAAIAVALGSALNMLGLGPRARSIDLVATGVVVGATITGSHVGTARGHYLTGLLAGSIAGGLGAAILRRSLA